LPTRFCLRGYMQIAVYHGERRIARQACWYPRGRKSLCEHETFYSLAGFRPRLPSLEKQRALTTHVPTCAKSESYKMPPSRHRNRRRQFHTLRSSIRPHECFSATDCNNVSRSHNPPRNSLTQPVSDTSWERLSILADYNIQSLLGFGGISVGDPPSRRICMQAFAIASWLSPHSEWGVKHGGGDPGAMWLREFHCVESGIDDGKDCSPIRAWRTVNAMDGPKFGSEEAVEWRSSIVSNRKCSSCTPKHGVF
jgi:hypothetical protein